MIQKQSMNLDSNKYKKDSAIKLLCLSAKNNKKLSLLKQKNNCLKIESQNWKIDSEKVRKDKRI